MEAISASGRFHATPVIVSDPEPQPAPIARAGDVHCSCCGRAPLVGEKVILHARPNGREAWACELCERSARRVGPLGEVRLRAYVRPGLAGAELYRAA